VGRCGQALAIAEVLLPKTKAQAKSLGSFFAAVKQQSKDLVKASSK
jgi:hypothetical protein